MWIRKEVHMSIFEAGMLICFGFAWPVSIYRTVKSKSTKGKSPVFSMVIIIGYLCGIIHKILHSNDIVMYLYILNMLMVSTDLAFWFRNRHYEKKEEAQKAASLS